MKGQQISHYEIIEKLGEGGMGVVYKALDLKLNREVALKFLPDRVNKDETAKTRFIQEARAVAALNHPNICTIFNVEEVNGSVFMVMEYVQGGTLRSKIPYAKVDDAVHVALQIGEALQEAHSKNIVHRDIKADNIMLTPKGQVKVMDFGLAKLKGALKLTKTSSTVGTLGYMAPEQIQGGEIDHRSDIFSFGVLLFEMLTGKLPFRGEHEAAMVYSIVNEEPQDIGQLLPELSPIVANLIARCLEKDPAERYQHFDDIVADLKRSQKKTTKVSRSTSDRPATGVHALSQATSATTAPSGSAPVPRGGKKGIVIGVAALVVVLAATGIYFFILKQQSGGTAAGADQVQTLAVLPFADMSPNKDQEYLSDGLSEELLNVLASNPRLRVTSRTSAFSFKGKEVDIRTIASTLNVKHILEGSVRKSGDALRITAELIDVEKDAHLWSQTYDGTMGNIFALQDSISRSVAAALDAALLGTAAPAEKHETTPEAYNAYMLGKHFSDLRGKENYEKAETYYKKAISIDPNYAPAWERLGSVHVFEADVGYISVDFGYRQAKEEIGKALELDPGFADAYARVGWMKMGYDWDFTGADEAYQHALQLEPGNRNAVTGAATLAATLGRLDESIKLYRRVTEIDPVWSTGYMNVGNKLMEAGKLDEAETAYRKALELDPQRPQIHCYLGSTYLEKGFPDSALAEIEKETEPAWKAYGLVFAYDALGRKKEADEALLYYINEYQNEGAFQIAEMYASRGEADKTFEWLDRAYMQRDGGLTDIKLDLYMKSVRNDPRYNGLLRKLKLPVD